MKLKYLVIFNILLDTFLQLFRKWKIMFFIVTAATRTASILSFYMIAWSMGILELIMPAADKRTFRGVVYCQMFLVKCVWN